MKKLALRGTLKTMGILGAVFLIVALILIVATMSTEDGLLAGIMMGLIFLVLFLIIAAVGLIPYWRCGRQIQRQCEQFGISEDDPQEFEMLTREVSMSSHWLINGGFGNNFALCRQAIDHIEESTFYQRGVAIPAILIVTGQKKKIRLVCGRRGDFDRIMDGLDRWFPPQPSALEEGTESSTRSQRAVRQQERSSGGKQVLLAMAAVVVMVAAFSLLYTLLPPHSSGGRPGGTDLPGISQSDPVQQLIDASSDDQFRRIAQGLQPVSDGDEDELEFYTTDLENGQTGFFLVNNTPYFYYGIMTVYEEESELAQLPIVLAKPYEITLIDGGVDGSPDQYVLSDGHFYSLSYAETYTAYQVSSSWDDQSSWMEIYVPSEDLDEAALTEICQAEYYSNVVSSLHDQVLYFFNDSSAYQNGDSSQGYDRSTAVYRAVLDIDNRQILLFSIENGVETQMDSLSME